MITGNKLSLKTIYELLGEQFYIPAYQRGYRWTDIQVRELLQDIWDFSQNKTEKASFYCLQPVVVTRRDDFWEVVDGQQRLTTLYVILHYLEREHLRRDLNEAYKKPLFSLKYETRKESSEFLQNIDEASANENIDFFHIAQAFREVCRWFSDRDYNDNNAFLATLLAKPSDNGSVQVIWYDLTDECIETDYAVEVFSRINIGKIPLTNAELIRALFLRSSNFPNEQASLKQVQIASEWDAIEQSLQEPSFWFFIFNTESRFRYDSRIEYIFDLMKGKRSGAEAFYTFHEFNSDFLKIESAAEGLQIESLWKEVKNYFLTFDEWYRDPELYHLIGFLVDCGRSIRSIKDVSKDITKSGFKDYLRNEIAKEVDCNIDDLAYGSDDRMIKKVLLLFNIQTLLATKEADIRFPFDRYKQEDWDIEHIRSQTDSEPVGASRISWLEDLSDYFSESQDITSLGYSSEHVGKIRRSILGLLAAGKINDSSFSECHENVDRFFNKGEIEEIDGIGNLALLDLGTNRSYKNAVFPVKRRRIIKNDMNGIFVPICTKNAFLKFYSKKLGEFMYWGQSDSDDYVSAMKSVLAPYLAYSESPQ